MFTLSDNSWMIQFIFKNRVVSYYITVSKSIKICKNRQCSILAYVEMACEVWCSICLAFGYTTHKPTTNPEKMFVFYFNLTQHFSIDDVNLVIALIFFFFLFIVLCRKNSKVIVSDGFTVSKHQWADDLVPLASSGHLCFLRGTEYYCASPNLAVGDQDLSGIVLPSWQKEDGGKLRSYVRGRLWDDWRRRLFASISME